MIKKKTFVCQKVFTLPKKLAQIWILKSFVLLSQPVLFDMYAVSLIGIGKWNQHTKCALHLWRESTILLYIYY